MKIMALICKMLILFLTHFIMSLFSICNGNLFKREIKGVWRMRNRTDFWRKYCFEDVSLFV